MDVNEMMLLVYRKDVNVLSCENNNSSNNHEIICAANCLTYISNTYAIFRRVIYAST